MRQLPELGARNNTAPLKQLDECKIQMCHSVLHLVSKNLRLSAAQHSSTVKKPRGILCATATGIALLPAEWYTGKRRGHWFSPTYNASHISNHRGDKSGNAPFAARCVQRNVLRLSFDIGYPDRPSPTSEWEDDSSCRL
ncbi:hypothetical protein FHL15_006630 [Xylaria flabelliformis]|uniref:Uncharacterized protein n=1 Tax=Xylaria flabelliformis TaxID=2512241 RepID=A0A553HWY3_9PEZI|nr:hypothetical protein FHL15_006630 [Xylaria flabelliformis]